MSNFRHAPLNRIPGLMPAMKSEKLIKDITALTQLQLLEVKEREEKLLANKAKIERLPDKGKRIREFYAKIVEEFDRRSNIEEAARLLSELNIVSKGEKVMNAMEWNNGKYTEADPIEDVLDSDDETEMDPLRVIAQRQMHQRRVKILKPEPSLITPQDLEEIKTFSANSSDSGLCTDSINSSPNDCQSEDTTVIDADLVAVDVSAKSPSLKTKLQELMHEHSKHDTSVELDKHARYVVDISEAHTQQREKFKPYKTTITNVHDPAKERDRKKGHKWEVTAATPPLIKHVGTQALSLLDSIEIQTNYLEKLKELHEKQAVDRLAAKLERIEKLKIKLPNSLEVKSNPAFTTYRSAANQIEGDQQYNENDEVLDPLDQDKCHGDNLTVFF